EVPGHEEKDFGDRGLSVPVESLGEGVERKEAHVGRSAAPGRRGAQVQVEDFARPGQRKQEGQRLAPLEVAHEASGLEEIHGKAPPLRVTVAPERRKLRFSITQAS